MPWMRHIAEYQRPVSWFLQIANLHSPGNMNDKLSHQIRVTNNIIYNLLLIFYLQIDFKAHTTPQIPSSSSLMTSRNFIGAVYIGDKHGQLPNLMLQCISHLRGTMEVKPCHKAVIITNIKSYQ